MTVRRYSPEEVEAILRRATEHEKAGLLVPPNQEAPHGLTLEEIVNASREAGIDPRAVRRAATLRLHTPNPTLDLATGGPLVHRIRGRVATSVLPSPEELDLTVQGVLGREGTVRSDEKARRWRGPGASVELRQGDGVADLTVEIDALGRYAGLVAGMALALFLFLQPFGGLRTLFAALGPFAATLLVAGAPLVLARPLWRAWSVERRRRAEALAMSVSELLERGG